MNNKGRHLHVIVTGVAVAFNAFIGSIGVSSICDEQRIVQ